MPYDFGNSQDYDEKGKPLKNKLRPRNVADSQAPTVKGGEKFRRPGTPTKSQWDEHRSWAKDFNDKLKRERGE